MRTRWLKRTCSAVGILVVLTACGDEAPAKAQTPPSPAAPPPVTGAVDTSRRTAIVTATERVAPAVVSVTAYRTRIVRGIAPSEDMFDLFFRDFLPRTRLYRERIPSLGSGVIVRESGLIVTNHHVIDRADEVSVTLADERHLKAEVVAVHPVSDVAVLRVAGDHLSAAKLGSSEGLMVGEWVIAVGNPFGQLISDAEPTVTIGVVSAKRRSFLPRGRGQRSYIDMIQTDAAINPGNSGGALANALGEVVGINTFIFSQAGGSIGLGFAIPIDHVQRVLTEYERHGTVREVWLGFQLAAITPEIRQALRLNDAAGAVVVEVYSQGPAYAAGLQPGDVIRRINGRAIEGIEDAQVALGYVFADDTYDMDVLRDGKVLSFTLQATMPQ